MSSVVMGTELPHPCCAVLAEFPLDASLALNYRWFRLQRTRVDSMGVARLLSVLKCQAVKFVVRSRTSTADVNVQAVGRVVLSVSSVFTRCRH